MTLKVLGCRVLVRPDPTPVRTADGSLHLVYDRQHSVMRGTVITRGSGPASVVRAVGALKERLAELHPELADELADLTIPRTLDLPPGTHVIFSPDAGQELFFERETLICVDEDDLLAVIAPEE